MFFIHQRKWSLNSSETHEVSKKYNCLWEINWFSKVSSSLKSFKIESRIESLQLWMILKKNGCPSNASFIINKQSIHIHNHRQRWFQQYSIDVSMGKAPIYPQPVNITSSESINRPKVSLRNDFFLPIPDHQLIEETMASIHDQLQCCLLFPRTNGKTPTTHTRSKTKTDEALSESTQKQRPTVSANPRLPMEDRRVRQAKLSSV